MRIMLLKLANIHAIETAELRFQFGLSLNAIRLGTDTLGVMCGFESREEPE